MPQQRKWPFVTKYCFCCELNVGICIQAVLFIVLLTIIMVHDLQVLIEIIRLCPTESLDRSMAAGDGICQTVGHTSLNKNFAIHSVLYLGMQLVSVATLMLLVYGIITKKPLFIKIFLRFSIPCWIYMTIIAALSVFMMDSLIRIAAIFFRFIDGYHILAVRSSYRVMTGKSKFYKETDSESIADVTDGTSDTRSFPPNYDEHVSSSNDMHCGTCTCGEGRTQPAPAPTQGADDRSMVPPIINPAVLRIDIRKEINIGSRGLTLRHPNNITDSSNATVVEEQLPAAATEGQYSPATADAATSTEKKEKKNFDDHPVIYDQSQFDVGDSLILENVRPDRDFAGVQSNNIT